MAAPQKKATTENVEKIDIKKKPQPIAEARMGLMEFVRNTFIATIPEGVAIDFVIAPEYWTHVAQKFQPWDHIEVRAEDGAFWAELIVLSTGKMTARVVPIRYIDLHLEQEKGMDVGENEVTWKGPHKKWCVLRKEDKVYLAEQLPSKQEAMQWIINNSRKQLA